MTAIGYVTKNDNGSYKGQLKTVSIRADIDIIPNRDKSAETHSGLRFAVPGVDIGAGWVRRGENSGTDYKPLARGARVRAAQALNQTFPALPARTVTASSP